MLKPFCLLFPGVVDMDEVTFAMVKPDGFIRGALGDILSMAYQCPAQLRPIILQQYRLTEVDVAFLYGHVKIAHPEVYPTLLDFSMSGPSYLMILRGNGGADAVQSWRDLMGATKSSEADHGTIRAALGSREVTCMNVVHGSDSHHRASEEIAYFASRLGW